MPIFPLLVVLFFTVPLIEIYLFIKIGGAIGILPTMAMVVLTAVLGSFLLRAQGLATFKRFQANMARGQAPAMEIMEGMALLVGGALLLTPGFFTDTVGFLCLIPYTRQTLIRGLMARYATRFKQSAHIHTEWRTSQHSDSRVIEGEFNKDKDG